MATYEYLARNAAGEDVAGVIQAETEAAVLRSLDERRLLPVRVGPQQAAARAARRGGKIPMRLLGASYGQLADLLRSGVPMLRSLDTLARAFTHPRLSGVIREVRDDVSAGKTLADAMADRGEVFPPLHVAMVRAGERAGFLEDVLTNLAEFMERQDELRGKVRGAMIYPLVLTAVGALGVIIMLVVLVPRFKPFFLNVALPWPTEILFALSELLVDHKWLLLGLVVLAVLAGRSLLKSRAGRDAWERWRIRMPVLGRVICIVSITRFCRILGTMLHNGVPILQSLAISKDATGSAVLASWIEQASENVRAGASLAEPLKASGLFPAEVLEMIAVAEESNQLERVLVQISDTIERRVNRQVDAAVRLIEPLILVVIAVGIGFMAVGLMYPIFTMSQTLR